MNGGAGTAINASAQYGIIALSEFAGDISVSTSTGDVINSGSSGIVAVNQATTILASAGSTVTVNAYGTINSGATLNLSGTALITGTHPFRPAGILAGYNGAATGAGTTNASVFGDVFVNNYANITAAAGDGIRAADFGVGDVTVYDGPGTTINAAVQYGIAAFNTLTGNISVSTSIGDVIVSGGGGILAVNSATAIPASAGSTVTVNAFGTIQSGSTLNLNGLAPNGVTAAYSSGIANPNVFGTVLVNNSANITAAAGAGIQAYSNAYGNVTVNDSAQTAVQGAQFGIEAKQENGGTGDVAVTVGAGASITGTASYGIDAESIGTGSISVTTASGDIVNSASSGIFADNQASSIPLAASSTITVNAYGTINIGTTLNGGGSPPAGIQAIYQGGTTNTPNANVFGNVFVYDYANINAAGGDGIRAVDWGNGNVAIVDEPITSISAPEYGISSFIEETGNISVSMSAGDTINAGSVGIRALNFATSVAASANSQINVTTNGTITSGSTVVNGNTPSGIYAGYSPGGNNASNLNVTGTVSVINGANITASAGWGIDAYNYGNGNVTVNDLANTTVTGVTNGITANQFGGGTGNVEIDIASGATVTGGTSSSAAVFARVNGVGTVLINNYGSIINPTGVTDNAINESLAGSDTGTINNYGSISGNITIANNTSVFNYAGATWNAGSITDNGAIVVSGAVSTVTTSTLSFGAGSTTVVVSNGGILDVKNGVSGTGSITLVGGGTFEVGGTDAQAVVFEGNGGTLKLDNPTPTTFTGQIKGLALGDVIDLTNTTVTSVVINGSTLTVTESNNSTLTYQVAGALSGNAFAIQSDGAGGADLVLTDASPNFWTNVYSPTQPATGVRLSGGDFQENAFTGTAAILYSNFSNYDPVNDPSGPYALVRSVVPLDPFFLQDLSGSQVVVPATETTLPAKSKLVLPSINTTGGIYAEGIAVYETQDGSGNNVINQIVGSPSSNQDNYSSLTFTSPTLIENAGTDTIYNLDVSFRQDNGTAPASYLSTYAVAWDQYNASSQTFGLEFQIFNADGSSSSSVITPVITPSGGTSVAASATPSASGVTSLPAWEFRNGGGIYALAIAEHNSTTNKDFIQFQGYNFDGTANTTNSADLESFSISANLSAYAAGATNHITQDVIPGLNPFPGSPSQQLNFRQVSANNANDWVVGWNETVTDSNGNFLGDQVEFVVDKPGNGLITIGPSNHYTVQLTDAQNVRVVTYTLNGQDFVVLAYGDGTATHLVDFQITNNGGTVTQIGTAIVDTTTQPFTTISSLGDGRVAVEYDNVLDSSGTSQYDIKIFDFRTAHINIDDSSLSDGQDKYIAGTHLGGDIFIGENNVNNFYYYVGVNGTANSTDTFNGGSNGWNAAVFADGRANYTIQQQAGGFLITNIGDSAHAGSLIVNGNVQALAFNPSHDPVPHSDGSLEATGDTLLILTNFANAAIIDAGATLEFFAADSGLVTFAGSTGTLRIDQPAEFTGKIVGISGSGNILDIGGFNSHSGDAFQTSAIYDGTDTTLTVTDTADNATQSVTLVGNYSISNGITWTAASDGNGGSQRGRPAGVGSLCGFVGGFLRNSQWRQWYHHLRRCGLFQHGNRKLHT